MWRFIRLILISLTMSLFLCSCATKALMESIKEREVRSYELTQNKDIKAAMTPDGELAIDGLYAKEGKTVTLKLVESTRNFYFEGEEQIPLIDLIEIDRKSSILIWDIPVYKVADRNERKYPCLVFSIEGASHCIRHYVTADVESEKRVLNYSYTVPQSRWKIAGKSMLLPFAVVGDFAGYVIGVALFLLMIAN